MPEVSVLIVDDEPEVREFLRKGLSAEGWTVFEAWSRDTLFSRIAENGVDIVTLDVTLGSEDGFQLALELRRKHNVPILMITGKTEPFDRVRGLECGADDYIVKPFLIREVILRINKTLERYRPRVAPPATVLFDDSELDLAHRVARHLDGTPLDLTPTELQLLELFVLHPGRVLSRDEISNALHGHDWSPYDRTIDGHVARLRRKIEPPDEEAPRLIRSVRGVGYVFYGDVTKMPAKS